MSKRFAKLSERLSADLPADPTRPDEDEEDEQPTSTDKDNEMTEEQISALKAEAKAEGVKESNDRMNTVFASEHYAGREASAHAMLAKNMTASDITDILATQPKAAPAAAVDDAAAKAAAEASGKAAMLAAIEDQKNADVLDGEATDKPDARAADDAVWAKAFGLNEKGAK